MTGSHRNQQLLRQAYSQTHVPRYRQSHGETDSPAENTQETDRHNRKTLRRKFPRPTLPTNSSWKPPNPLHLKTDAPALSYTLSLRKTHLDNSHGHTHKDSLILSPQKLTSHRHPQTTGCSLIRYSIHRMKITGKPGTAKTARQQILTESLFGAERCGYNWMLQLDTESHRLFTGRSPQIFQQCLRAPDLVCLLRMTLPPLLTLL